MRQILPIGTIRIRTRHKRGGQQRAYIKIAQPNTWILRARHMWEAANGPIPAGMGVHHKDENKLNDAIGNLELKSKAGHLAVHVGAYRTRIVKNLVAHRRKRRWSTKSLTKRTGRPPVNDEKRVNLAADAYTRGEGTYRALGARFGVAWGAIAGKIRRQ